MHVWRNSNPERARATVRKYALAHPDKTAAKGKKWSKANPEKIRAKREKWRKAHPEKVSEIYKNWIFEHPEKVKEYKRKANLKARSTTSGILSSNTRTRISLSLKGTKKGQHWETLVGYNVTQLKHHLEKQFTPEMSWNNYGTYWHIDHKIPISVFNYKTATDIDFKKCWSLKNLRPLEAKENIRKGAKLKKPFQPSLLMVA
jgi:hypothetical protein